MCTIVVVNPLCSIHTFRFGVRFLHFGPENAPYCDNAISECKNTTKIEKNVN